MKLRGARVASLILACSLALSSCGGDDDKDGKEKDDQTSSPSETSSDDNGITAPGTALKIGETATVVWSPNQNVSSTVAITLNRIDRGAAKDLRAIRIDPPLKNPRLYYARFTFENKGETNLGKLTPLALLYLDNGSDVLTPAADLRVMFKPCQLKPLPASFGQGKRASLCLVYAVGSELRNISLRPNDEDEMITWTGKVTNPVTPKKKPKKQG